MKKITPLTLSILLFSFSQIYSQGKWTTYGEELNAGSLSSGNLTTSMIEDKNGNLVVACYKGTFLKYDGKEWSVFYKNLRSKEVAVWDLPAMDEKTGYIWYVSNSGVALWDGNESYSMSGVVDLGNRMIYTDTYDHYVTFSHNQKTKLPDDPRGKELIPPTHLYSVLVDSKGQVLLGNLAGRLFIRMADGLSWTEASDVVDADIEKMVKRDHKRINKLFEDKDNNIWVVTSSGVGKFDPELNFSFEKPLEFANSIFQDSKGNIWVGSVDGVTRFDGSRWKTWGKDDGIEDVRLPDRFLEDKEGNIWFCSKTILATRKGGGLYQFDGSKWVSHQVDKKNFVADILIDRNGTLWCATIGGAYQYHSGQWKLIRELEGFAKFYHQMYETSNGDIWFGTSTIKGYIERYTP
ncbi:two-component regulator propeller domain-containing protein [Bacteroidota bacterium]